MDWWLDLDALNILILFENKVTLQLPRRSYGEMFKEASLNHMDFTGLIYINHWPIYFHFLQQMFFHPPCSQISECKSTPESFWGSMWFITFDGLCNYLHSFRRQQAVSFLKITTAAFLNRKFLATALRYLLKQDLAYSSNIV